MIKRFCDICGEAMNNSSGWELSYVYTGDDSVHPTKWDMCWECKGEFTIFMTEYCDKHALSKTQKALEDLKL